MNNIFEDIKHRMIDSAKKVNESYLADDMQRAYIAYGSCRAYAEVLMEFGHRVRIETDMMKHCFIDFIVIGGEVISFVD